RPLPPHWCRRAWMVAAQGVSRFQSEQFEGEVSNAGMHESKVTTTRVRLRGAYEGFWLDMSLATSPALEERVNALLADGRASARRWEASGKALAELRSLLGPLIVAWNVADLYSPRLLPRTALAMESIPGGAVGGVAPGRLGARRGS